MIDRYIKNYCIAADGDGWRSCGLQRLKFMTSDVTGCQLERVWQVVNCSKFPRNVMMMMTAGARPENIKDAGLYVLAWGAAA